MSEAFVGEIRIFANNFVPYGWLPCDGQLYPVAQFQLLFAIIGNTYGGISSKTFATPNLVGASDSVASPVVAGVGQSGPGAKVWQLGKTAGERQVILNSTQFPSHTHQMVRAGGNWVANKKLSVPSATSQVGGLYPDATHTGDALIVASPTTTLSPQAVGAFGGSTAGTADPHENRQPFLALLFGICYDGVYPVPAD